MFTIHLRVSTQNDAAQSWSARPKTIPIFGAWTRKFSGAHVVYPALLYTKQNTDRMLKFDWLRAIPYACVRTDVWTGWTSVHNNKRKHWFFVVLLVWVYNKAFINLEFVHTENICCDVMSQGRHFVRSVRHDVTTNIFAYGPHSRLIRAYYSNFSLSHVYASRHSLSRFLVVCAPQAYKFTSCNLVWLQRKWCCESGTRTSLTPEI